MQGHRLGIVVREAHTQLPITPIVARRYSSTALGSTWYVLKALPSAAIDQGEELW